MLPRMRGFIAGLLLIAVTGFAEQPEPLIWGVIPDYPPYSFITDDGGIDGFVVELISSILDELDVEYTFNIETWDTMYGRVLNGEVHVYAPFVRIPERRETVYWPEHSIISSYTGIATVQQDTLNTFESLANKTFIAIENDFPSITAFEQFMESMLIPFTLNTVPSFDVALEVLHQGDAAGLVVDNMLAMIHPDLFLSTIAFNPRAAYWTSAIDAEPWVIDIVNQVAERLSELQNSPSSKYYELRGKYFQLRTPAVETLPAWGVLVMSVLLAAIVISLVIVHLLTQRIRANATMLREAVHHKTVELTSVYEQLIQSEKMVTLGEAVAGMAHEVSTPLGVAYTASTLLNAALQRPTDEFLVVANDALPVIVENLRRAGSLIQTFKQITIDQTSGSLRDVVLPDYFQQVWTSLLQKYGNRKIHFICYAENHLNEHITARIKTYPGAFSRILIHLFDNAVEHGFTSNIRNPMIKCISKIYHKDDEMYIQITVEDNGIGYPKDIQSKIMEPFFTTRIADVAHSGLGLPSVYRILEKTWNLKSFKIENREEGGVRVQALLQVRTEEEKSVKILD